MPTYAVRTWLVIALAAAVGWSSSASAAVKPVSASGTAERNTGQPVEVYMTTWDGAKRLSQEAGVSFRPDRSPHPYTIHVDESRTYQTMDGYGASLTDSSAYVIYHHLDEKKRTELMRQLFDPVQGIGLSYLRLPMGASDFALNDYTYDDMPEGQVDPDLEHFSIEHDRAYILPVLKQALKINPQLKVMGTPWSAPAWMKSTGRLQKGKLLTEYYGAYAQYFVKFIRAYAAEGVPIHAVTLQNEPQYEPSGYPGMVMEPEDQAEFVKNHLGPAFREAGIKTEIIVWDHNWDHPEYPIEVLNDGEAKPYIAGSAFHSYGGAVENQAQVHDEHPDKGIYFTESSGVTEYPVFGDNVNWDLSNLLIRSTRYWAKTVLKWNLALDENNGPLNGGCSTCRGVVTVTSDGSVTLNEEYYAFGHASKFVQPGAVRIASNTFGPGSLETAAFRNPDGSKALIVLNGAGEEREFQVRWGNAGYTYKLPAKAAATFKWNGRTGAGTDGINPYSRVEAEEAAELRGVLAGIARDTAGGGLVGSDSRAGGYIAFKDVEVVSGTASADIRYASAQDVRIELRLGSPNGAYVGELDTGATGGDQVWATKRIPVEIPPGTHKLFLVFQSPVNLNWFQFGFTSAKELHNYAARNGSFEDGAPGPWQGWSPEGQASAQKVESGDAHSGEYKLTHWSAGPYKQGTSRTIEVPNGTYQASVWVKKGDGIDTRLTIRNYGGPEMSAEAGNGGISSWKQLTTGPFLVTSGRVELELHSEAAKSEWATFDDVELKPVPTAAPAAPTAPGAPPAPRQVTAGVVGEGQSIRLSWEGAKGAAAYKIYRSITEDSDRRDPKRGGAELALHDYQEIGAVPSGTTVYVDQGLRGKTRYYYRVTAVNPSGESQASQAVKTNTRPGNDDAAPPAPGGLTAEAGAEQVTLRWMPSLESDFLKYSVYVDGIRRASVDPVTESQFTLEGLTPGRPYSFTVSAVDRSGNESVHSAPAAAVPQAKPVQVAIENGGFEQGDFSGWNEWHPEGQAAAQFIDSDSPRGAYKLTHWAGTDYRQSTYRTLEVPDGRYKVQVWARTGGGQNTFRLEVKPYGGTELVKDMKGASGGSWTPYVIDGIEVRGGRLEIGVFSDAKAGNWAAVDDFELYRYP